MTPATDDVQAWAGQLARTGGCRHPVRLRGRVDAVHTGTGELRVVFDSAGEEAGVLLVSCRNRRATACPACAEVYRHDAWQIIVAGLRGGKGLPASVAGHPRVFVTLTAPSFGAVHSRRERAGQLRRCRPRGSGTCPHGLPRGCRVRHGGGAALLGQPLCASCFDAAGAVLWNAHAGELWRRVTIAIRRTLATGAGLTVRALAEHVRLSFGKVAEYQARGLVHLHAVIRLDGVSPTAEPTLIVAPPAAFTVLLLDEAIRAAVPRVRVLVPAGRDEPARTVLWGEQLDVRHLTSSQSSDRHRAEAVAGYIAKYATKSTDPLGALDHRIRTAAEIERLAVNAHLRRLVTTCWRLGADPAYAHLRLRAWAHTLGYRGHWTTKSRSYSTTFTALRAARVEHASAAHDEGIDAASHDVVGSWHYAGRGYRNGPTR